MDTLQIAHVTISWEGGKNEQTKVRAQVSGDGEHFEASATDWKAHEAVDTTRARLSEQIRREHNKKIDKEHHRH